MRNGNRHDGAGREGGTNNRHGGDGTGRDAGLKAPGKRLKVGTNITITITITMEVDVGMKVDTIRMEKSP